MIVDTSALAAMVFDEPEMVRLAAAIYSAEIVRAGAPTLVEATAVVMGRLGPGGLAKLRHHRRAGRAVLTRPARRR